MYGFNEMYDLNTNFTSKLFFKMPARKEITIEKLDAYRVDFVISNYKTKLLTVEDGNLPACGSKLEANTDECDVFRTGTIRFKGQFQYFIEGKSAPLRLILIIEC